MGLVALVADKRHRGKWFDHNYGPLSSCSGNPLHQISVGKVNYKIMLVSLTSSIDNKLYKGLGVRWFGTTGDRFLINGKGYDTWYW